MFQRCLRVSASRSWRRASPLGSLDRARRGLVTQSYVEGPREVCTRDSRALDAKLSELQPALLDQTIGENFAGIVSAFGDRKAYVPLLQR